MLALVFMSIWLGAVLIIALTVLISFFISSEPQAGFPFAVFIPFLMFAFGYALFTVPFRIESQKSKEFLADLLEGEIRS